jgi:hypothetical protein
LPLLWRMTGTLRRQPGAFPLRRRPLGWIDEAPRVSLTPQVGTVNLALQHGQMISAMLHPRDGGVRDRGAILHPLVRRKQGKTWNGQLGAATLAGRSPLDLRAEPSAITEPTAESFLITSESSIWSAIR